jgi:predicted benzoate:H+ symporter BenE
MSREPVSRARCWRFLQKASGACGDLGTFIPHAIGARCCSASVFLIFSGLLYGLPMLVQPIKAVSAVILTDGLRPGEVAGAGLVMGMLLLVLGFTGAMGRVARLIPQSVSVGLQLGLGLLMAVLGVGLMLKTRWLGIGALALLLLLTRIPYYPAAPIVLLGAVFAGWSAHEITVPDGISLTWSLPQLVIPSWPELWRSIEFAVVPL